MGRPRKSTQSTKSHLTEDERITIQTMLANNQSPYQISKVICKSASTITREIDKHAKIIKAKPVCKNQHDCLRKKLCKGRYCTKYCKTCLTCDCTTLCPDFEIAICPKILKSPHVCNGCDKFDKCKLEKRLYKAIYAQSEYSSMLIDKRSGYDLTIEELTKIDGLITPLIKAGHSPYAVITELGDVLPCSRSTLYRLIDSGLLEVRNIDLYEKVKRKPRRHTAPLNKDGYAIISKAKRGHLWNDYLIFKEAHPDMFTVQMDCVEGKKEDSAVLLTLDWIIEHMQLYFIMDKQEASEVVNQLDKIEQALGYELFCEMFPIILTDNGHEFSDVHGIEFSCLYEGRKRTNLFFCEPNRSDEKGHCERNHRELRKIIPKGTSLEKFTQFDMSKVTNHVNSYVRASLGGVTPYDLAIDNYDEDFFILLGLEKIPMKDVILKPDLLK